VHASTVTAISAVIFPSTSWDEARAARRAPVRFLGSTERSEWCRSAGPQCRIGKAALRSES